jgi:hypothetical protein
MTTWARRILLWGICGVLACSSDDDGRTGGGGGGGGDDGTGSGNDDGGDDGGKWDVGGGTGGDGQGDEEGSEICKIDFLFIIDNTQSMEDEQNALIASLPGFIQTISEELQVTDWHVLITDTDAGYGGADPCDSTLGAGRVLDQLGQDCGVTSGARYILPDQPNVDAVFQCVANVGTGGDNNERPMEAMEQAIGPLNGAGQCNDGFVREDALLVITIITDEEEDPNDGDGGGSPDVNSPGGPADWYQAVVDAKLGKESHAVVLGLVGDTDLPNAVCVPRNGTVGAEPAIRLREFIESFTYGAWEPVCQQSYDEFFQSSVSELGDACESFEPPG